VNPHAAVGAGRARKPWRIKEWMDAVGIRQEHVAVRAGINTKSIVSRTIRGQANNRKVLLALRDMGCPEKYLGLPDDLIGLPEQEEKRVA
jgi:transcriptional regulator with XRE-family HTH domain